MTAFPDLFGLRLWALGSSKTFESTFEDFAKAWSLKPRASVFRHNSSVRAQFLPVLAVCVLAGATTTGQMRPAAGSPERDGVKRITWADAAPLRAPARVPRVHGSLIRVARRSPARDPPQSRPPGRPRSPHLLPAAIDDLHVSWLRSNRRSAPRRSWSRWAHRNARHSFVAAAPPACTCRRPCACVRPRCSRLSNDRRATRGWCISASSSRRPSPRPRNAKAALVDEYLRVMRFVYEKEFVAQRAPRPADAVADLYRSRGLSTDTAVEAGYLVSIGLGIVKALEPDRRIRRVLIVGPGLDLAPRTGMLEAGPPESYQPWAVIDALVASGLSRLGRPRGACGGHQSSRGVAPAPRPRRATDLESHQRDRRQRVRHPRSRVP